MELKRKKTISIFRLFLNYIIGLSAAIIALISGLLLILAFSFQTGLILPANYAEVKLNQLEKDFREEFDESLLPPHCSYLIIDKNIGILEKNMAQPDVEKTKSYLLHGTKAYHDAYKIIHQTNGNSLIIKYDILAHFSNPMLHKWLPRPEFSVLAVLFGFILLFTIIAASNFSKKMKENLAPIITAAKKIEMQDLCFEIHPTKISEFNSALEAINQLKQALTASLDEQWNKEQQRKLQLSALAHDIKTPLTVIKGNSELLAEEEHSKESLELLSYIHSNSNTIETYLEVLMNVLNDRALDNHIESVQLKDWLHELTEAALPLCNLKGIHLNLNCLARCDSLLIDKELVKRAILNLIDNAVQYSGEGSSIDIRIQDDETHIIFEVLDCGKGFSPEALRKATQEFFTEDTSRTNKHYGLGLNFVKRVAEMYHGTLTIENRVDKQGGRVILCLVKPTSTSISPDEHTVL